MKAFREIRARHSILEICKIPELAAEITLQPLQVFDLDAAIIFADILLPLEPMGLQLNFVKGEGPVISNRIRSIDDVSALRPVVVEESLSGVLSAIRLARKALQVPLIGFAGAPFTLASYMIEGGASRAYLCTKQMMYSTPEAWDLLMRRLTCVTTDYLLAQVTAGAEALQVFDSWVGALSPYDYRRFVLPYMKMLFEGLSTHVPIIHFGTGTATLLSLQKEAGGDVIGLDWRIPLDEGWKIIGFDRAVQGNLDPAVLFGPASEIHHQIDDILMRAEGRPGHIFNLGHGILPETPIDHVATAIERVHERSAGIVSARPA